MKIIIVDWEIEKEDQKLFRDCNYRFQLQEILEENYSQVIKRVILNTNNIDDIMLKIGKLMISHPKCFDLEMVTNKTLKYYQKQQCENLIDTE